MAEMRGVKKGGYYRLLVVLFFSSGIIGWTYGEMKECGRGGLGG